jgi:hypothetical protein
MVSFLLDNRTFVLYCVGNSTSFYPFFWQDFLMTRSRRQQRLDQAVALLRQQYGEGILRRASELGRVAVPPHIRTGFAELDALTGCAGIPLDGLTILSGRTTSGKLTVAYKVLANAQASRPLPVALLDLTQSSDPDYLTRCGVGLPSLLLLRPRSGVEAVNLLLELVQSRQVQVVLMDGLPDLGTDRSALGHLNRSLPALQRLLHGSGCGVLLLDEPHPPWLRWLGWQPSAGVEQWAALHLGLERERWLLRDDDQLHGYQARVRLHKSRWARRGATASLGIHFNGTVHAARTW